MHSQRQTLKQATAGIILCFTVGLFFAPNSVQAQTPVTEEAYRATLFELIDTLLKQIAVLQAQLDSQQQLEREESNQAFSNEDIVHTYTLTGESSADLIQNIAQRKYLKRVYELFPDEFDAKLTRFVVFADSEEAFDAYVETIAPKHVTWTFAINEAVLPEVYSAANTELIVHELAHIISFEEVPGVALPQTATCSPYFRKRGCPKNNAYITLYAEEFWTTSDIARAQRFADRDAPVADAQDYYDDHKQRYVSSYAALSPEEDFSESFAQFVINQPQTPGTEAAEKVQWFEQYAELRAIKRSIWLRVYLSSWIFW